MFDQGSREQPGPFDELVEIKVYIGLAIAAVMGAGTMWLTGVNWLVAHSILIAAAEHPMVRLPYAKGAGLDFGRSAIAACIIVAALAIAFSSLRRGIQRRRYR